MLVTVEDGRAVRVAGDPEHPFTRGFLCAKVNRYVERTYHHDRLAHAAAACRAEGERPVRAHLVGRSARRDRRAAAARSPRRATGRRRSCPYSYAGTMGLVQGSSMDRRFFHALGASLLDRTICSMAGTVGMRMTVGREHRRRRRRDSRERSRAAVGHEHAHGEPAPLAVRPRRRASAARRSSASIRSGRARPRSATSGSPIRPGTDAALALGMMHVLFARGLEDRDYLDAAHARPRGSCASARASTRRSASRRSPGLPAETIVSLGERYGARERGVHPRELRAAAPRRRRHGGAHHRLPAGDHRALAPRRAAACSSRRAANFSFNKRGARAARPRRRRCARST